MCVGPCGLLDIFVVSRRMRDLRDVHHASREAWRSENSDLDSEGAVMSRIRVLRMYGSVFP